jgi:IS1 family transposase
VALPPKAGKGGPVANILSEQKRLRILAVLVEGNSERATERMTDVPQKTVGRFGLQCGRGAANLHDRLVRDLSCTRIEVDEIWSYVGKKQARVGPADPPEIGEAYTFVALDASSRLVIAYYVGKRDEPSAQAFIADVRARLRVMPAMTSDGFTPYVPAIDASFGPSIDYGQVVKHYTKSGRRDDDHRYEPPREPFLTKRVVSGSPDLAQLSTAHVERNNGTMRHHIGRIRRLCLAFSKKLPNHQAAIALNYAWYNFGLVVHTLRVTPAMAAGITDHLWTLDEFMATILAEAEGPKPVPQPLVHPKPPGPSRELPNGRGFLRLVHGGASPAPAPAPAAPTLVRPEQGPASAGPPAAVDEAEQLDLFAWKPEPREPAQLDLFDRPDGT